jgi:hypothetical protein
MTTTPIAANAPALAARVVALGVLVNCVLKTFLSLALGTARSVAKACTTTTGRPEGLHYDCGDIARTASTMWFAEMP